MGRHLAALQGGYSRFSFPCYIGFAGIGKHESVPEVACREKRRTCQADFLGRIAGRKCKMVYLDAA